MGEVYEIVDHCDEDAPEAPEQLKASALLKRWVRAKARAAHLRNVDQPWLDTAMQRAVEAYLDELCPGWRDAA
jgi:hypothetical protein